MTKEQYKRANGLVGPLMLVILVYMALSMVGAMLTGNLGVKTIVQLIAILLGIVITVLGFITKREEKMGSIMIVIGGTLAYFVMMCVSISAMTFLYAFPIMFASMVYLNARMMLWGDILVIIGTTIQIIRLSMLGILDLDFTFVEVMTILLCVLASLMSARMLDKFNKENMSVIESKAKDQASKAKNMAIASENLMEHFDKSGSVIEQLNECITANNFSMKNIAQSTESTAEAVQQQAVMCNEITNSTEIAETEIKHMLDAAEKTLETVTEGVTLIDELKNQSQIVREASNTTVASTEELTKKITEVEGIVGAILSISAQTNLLALNASIEAARAGDAGKGFAVVADEIRQLSEQTKESVNKITNIINDLSNYAVDANRSVEDTIHSVEKQNEMIENSQKKFTVISEEVESLSSLVEKTEGIMKEIFNSTNIITENIGHLSATSEEVAASSTEGLSTSGEAVKEMEKFIQLLKALNIIAEDLKAYAKIDGQ